MAEFTFAVGHRAGKSHGNADGLTCKDETDDDKVDLSVNALHIQSDEYVCWREATSSDPDLVPILNRISEGAVR